MSEQGKTISIKEIAPPTWPETCKEEVEAILNRYPEGREQSAILPLLHLAMRERDGHYVAVSDMAEIADICGVSTAFVDSVCSFYAMFHRHPVGKYVITICGNMACHLLGGGRELVRHVEQTLGITNGETTEDGLITLEVTGECLAACDLAPVIHVNTEYAVKMTPAKWDLLVEALRSGQGPDAFLEKLPLMGGANQEDWQGFKPCSGGCGGAKAAGEVAATEAAAAEQPVEAGQVTIEEPVKSPATPE